jgi:hypothetical protein
MRSRLVLAVILITSLTRGEEPKKYRHGQLLETESLQCTVLQSSTSEVNAADSTICEEYVLEGEDVLFHLRAKDTKHPVLLPVGKEVSYRMEADRLFLRLTHNDRKEHEYLVVAMEPREKSEVPVQSARRANHLR